MYSKDHRTIAWHLDYILSPENIGMPRKVTSSNRIYSFFTVRNRYFIVVRIIFSQYVNLASFLAIFHRFFYVEAKNVPQTTQKW